MSFDLDDPLGDLLSDGSNDSFFGDAPKKNSTKEAKIASSSKTSSSKKMDELFGIKNEEKVEAAPVPVVAPQPKPQTPPVKSKPTTPLKKSQTPEKDDEGDVFSDLGFDPKKPKSKTNVLEDILGLTSEPPKPRPKTASAPAAKDPPVSRPLTGPSPKEDTPRTTPRETPKMSRQSTFTSDATDATVYAPAPRRGTRRQSSLLNMDPLGLFSKPEEKPAPKPEPQMEAQQAPLPAPRAEVKAPQSLLETDSRAQMLAFTATETESAISALKQQESQLAMASQMRNQETALVGMQKKQQELLQQQETQFNDLLQKQLQRQVQLEETIRAQQDRINAHIQLLMLPPHQVGSQLKPQKSTEESASEEEAKTEVELRAEVKELELEKLRLEDLLANVNSNHEQEIVFLEQSHKKQIRLLEENLTKTEERLRAENKSLQEFYFAKIGDLESEKQHVVDESRARIRDLKEGHEKTVEEMKKRYQEDLEELERNYKRMVSSIQQSKLTEFAIVQESSSYLDTLKSAFHTMENANDGLSEIRDFLRTKIDDVYVQKEAQISARERKVEGLEQYLSRSKEAQEEERRQLLELVRTLELKVSTSEQVNSEQTWKLQQQQNSLEVEKAAFEREKSFLREQIQREQRRLEDQKHLQTTEYDRLVKQLEEDRMNLITEKTRLETNMRLQKPSDSGASRAEIEAAIKVAEEASRQTETERERLIVVQKQFEQRRRELLDQEGSLRTRESQMEEAIKMARAKERQAENSLESAKVLERSVLVKLNVLQKHARELKEREVQLSHDKTSLSRERMELETLRKKALDNRCSLCKLGTRSQEISNLVMGETDLLKDDIDVDIENSLSRLRVEAGNVSALEDTAFEVNLDNIPNLIETSDNLLDSDLLLLKFDVLNSLQKPQFMS